MMHKIETLKKILKKIIWTDKFNIIKPHLLEERGNLSGKSSLLIHPKNTYDVVQVLKACNKYKISIVPQGGRTGLCGGTVPNMNGREVLLTTEKIYYI